MPTTMPSDDVSNFLKGYKKLTNFIAEHGVGDDEHRPSEDLDITRPGNTCAMAAAFDKIDNMKGGKRRPMNRKR